MSACEQLWTRPVHCEHCICLFAWLPACLYICDRQCEKYSFDKDGVAEDEGITKPQHSNCGAAGERLGWLIPKRLLGCVGCQQCVSCLSNDGTWPNIVSMRMGLKRYFQRFREGPDCTKGVDSSKGRYSFVA